MAITSLNGDYNPSRYKIYMQNGSATAAVGNIATYQTLLSKIGKGYLSWALINTAGVGQANIRVTLDGVIINNTTGGNNGTFNGASGITQVGTVTYNGSNMRMVQDNFQTSISNLSYPTTAPTSTSSIQPPIFLPGNLYYDNSLLIEVSCTSNAAGYILFSYGGADFI